MIKLVTITGPSCSGKTTLTRRLLEDSRFCELVSCTTRVAREGEVEGKDYYFISKEKADSLIAEDAFAEYIFYSGNTYGITKDEILQKTFTGKVPVVVVDPIGSNKLKHLYGSNIFSVYVNSNYDTLLYRFLERAVSQGVNADISYYVNRLKEMIDEYFSWWSEGKWDFQIDNFTSETEESIVTSLINTIFKEQERSDKS